jgi:hypothetical protein
MKNSLFFYYFFFAWIPRPYTVVSSYFVFWYWSPLNFEERDNYLCIYIGKMNKYYKFRLSRICITAVYVFLLFFLLLLNSICVCVRACVRVCVQFVFFCLFTLAFFFFFCYKGFSLGSTVRSETKGIWAWCKPHPTQKEQVLLLLDTEGLGDVAKVKLY